MSKNKQRSKSSGRWLQEHFKDQYVKAAQKQGLRSRAVFKLEAIQLKDKLLKPGQVVVDLGAAPGGWSEYAVKIVGAKGEVFALDCLDIDPIEGVTFLQGDFSENEVHEQFLELLGDRRVDVVLSDMAPNLCGMPAVDQPRSMALAELALDFAIQTIGKKGAFVVKVFQGEGFDPFLRQVRDAFKKVVVRKPPASRARSREVYLIGTK